MTAKALLQIPERCYFNLYVVLQAEALVGRGYATWLPGLCEDHPEPPEPTGPPFVLLRHGGLLVVHVHWPEKLLRTHRPAEVVALFRALRVQGAIVVRTHHNRAAHDQDTGLLEWALYGLTDGHHYFSTEHRAAIEGDFGAAPGGALIQGHPQYPLPAPHPEPMARPAAGDRGDRIVVGWFGRIRPYKRIVEFTRAFARRKPAWARLVVHGRPDSAEIDAAMRTLAAEAVGIDYHSGFADYSALVAAMRSVDYVVLPYRELWSSGILVLALQLGIPVIAPRPTMDLPPSAAVATLSPWRDEDALDWLAAHGRPRAELRIPAGQARLFPTWPDAAVGLDRFYTELATRRQA